MLSLAKHLKEQREYSANVSQVAVSRLGAHILSYMSKKEVEYGYLLPFQLNSRKSSMTFETARVLKKLIDAGLLSSRMVASLGSVGALKDMDAITK